MREQLRLFIILLSFGSLCLSPAQADETPLPYSNRTAGYSGWSPTVRGDIHTIGMAGAMVGLADTFIGSGDNPAGLAMTLENVGATVTSNNIKDGYVQSYTEGISSSSLGIAASSYPWGFSLGYWIPANEGQTYRLLNGQLVDTQIEVREIRASVAHLFFENKLSLGASLVFGQAAESLQYRATGLDETEHISRIGMSAGAMYQLEHRVLLGVSYSLPLFYTTNPLDHPTAGVSNFFQSVRTPYRLNLGAGFIPNRFVRIGAALYIIGSTPGAALLSDNDRSVGETPTVQPRFGVAYTVAEFKHFKTEISGGTYYEPSRVSNTANRIHGTFGIDMNVWVFNLGFGLDEAAHYENQIFSAGIDVVRLIRALDLIPDSWHPPYGGFAPRLAYASDEGLARPLVKDWQDHGQGAADILEIGTELPKRLEEKLRGVAPPSTENSRDDVDDSGDDDSPIAVPQNNQKLNGTKGVPRVSPSSAPSGESDWD